MTISFEDLSYQELPKQRIFLSIDAIGSTRLKTISYEEAENNINTTDIPYNGFWLTTLLDFLSEVGLIFAKKFKDIVEQCKGKANCKLDVISKIKDYKCQCIAPSVWKFVGDEVILVADLICPIQPFCYVKALCNTLNELNKSFATKAKNADSTTNKELQFKGTAWVAGFPVTNAPIKLYMEKDKNVYDFIGPSLDLGFRLSKLSSKSKVVISTSLVKLLLETPNQIDIMDELPIYSSGFAEIKGVKNSEHPLFWVVPKKEDCLEQSLYSPLKKTDLENFLNKYYSGKDCPFILDITLDNIPSEYKEQFLRAIRHQSSLKHSLYYKMNNALLDSSAQHEDSGISAEEFIEKNYPK